MAVEYRSIYPNVFQEGITYISNFHRQNSIHCVQIEYKRA